jgi:hypothetical protein
MNNREKPPKQVEDAYLDALYARVRELDKDIKAWPFVWNWNLIQLAWRRNHFTVRMFRVSGPKMPFLGAESGLSGVACQGMAISSLTAHTRALKGNLG